MEEAYELGFRFVELALRDVVRRTHWWSSLRGRRASVDVSGVGHFLVGVFFTDLTFFFATHSFLLARG